MYAVTASCSVFAYVWLLIILIAVSPDIIELWEAILTFVFFWILLVVCYAADRNWFRSDKGKVAPMSKTIAQLPVDENGGKANGDTSSEKPKAGLKALGLARQATGALQGLSNNEQHALAKQTMEMLPPTSAVHRRNACTAQPLECSTSYLRPQPNSRHLMPPPAILPAQCIGSPARRPSPCSRRCARSPPR